MSEKDKIHVLARAVIIDRDHILLCQTQNLPISFYFLPGGHVEHGESAQDGLLRELIEEAGATARIKRFLGCLEHSFEPAYSSICHNHEYNLMFEVESDDLKFGRDIPQIEAHIKLVWIPLNALAKIDLRAPSMKELVVKWLKSDIDEGFSSAMR